MFEITVCDVSNVEWIVEIEPVHMMMKRLLPCCAACHMYIYIYIYTYTHTYVYIIYIYVYTHYRKEAKEFG